MKRDDLRMLCSALGFLVVVLKDVDEPNRAARARTMAQLMESFCLPEAERDSAKIDGIIDRYKAELPNAELPALPADRKLLLRMYDRLIERQQSWLHTTGGGEIVMAEQIRRLAGEEIARDEADGWSPCQP